MRWAAALVLAGMLGACGVTDPAAIAERNFVSCQSPVDMGGRASACSAFIRDTTQSNERRALAFFHRGMVRLGAFEMTRAVMDFSRAIRLDPNLGEAYYQRGYVHHENGSFDAAVADYERALAINPNHYEAAQRRDIALSGQVQEFAVRMATADAAIARDPSAVNYNNRCWTRAVEGVELEAALTDCNRALILAPNDPQTLDSRGLVYLKLGQNQEALIDYEAALAAQPDVAHFLYGRGIAKYNMGNVTDGLADVARAIELDASIARTYAQYGVAQPSAVEVEKL